MAADCVIQPGFRNAVDGNANIVKGIVAFVSKTPDILIQMDLNRESWDIINNLNESHV